MLSPLLTREQEETNQELQTLWDKMKETAKNPGVPAVCQSDTIVTEFALSQLDRIGTAEEQRKKDMDNVRTKIRTIGRLLKKINQRESNWKSMSDILTGQQFDSVVKATKELALESDSPQLALVLSRYVKQCCLLKMSVGIKTGDEKMQKEAKDFDYLYQAHWNNSVSCVALRRQRLRKINKKPNTPSTADVVTLSTWLQKPIEKRLQRETFEQNEWREFAEIVLARILVFNRRRISEVEEMKWDDFNRRWTMEDGDNEDIINSLDLSEKTLAKRYVICK